MNAVFADTFYWIALTNLQDMAHERAKALTFSLGRRPILTTQEVLTEYLNYFAAWGESFRHKVVINLRTILRSEAVRVMPQTEASFLAGLELYGARLDKGYSLTDCISMQAMRAERVAEALTSDIHFEQEGFEALFRST